MASRNLYCADCAKDKIEGVVRHDYEQPEFTRAKWGQAKEPTEQQRTAYVNGEPIKLAPGVYECDLCCKPIHPGERCCAVTYWVGEDTVVPKWEQEFIQ